VRGSPDAACLLVVITVKQGAPVATSVVTSGISSPTVMPGAAILKVEESLARIDLGQRLSRDGVWRLNVLASSSEAELERVCTGVDGKERG
jgi:hypothetical protein